MSTVEEARKRAERDATRNRMHLCPDSTMLQDLLEGLVENEERYGYPSCPCRMATGDFEKDKDIICPCYYRDPDVEEYGQCYCSLYVNDAVYNGDAAISSIPERRPKEKQMASLRHEEPETSERVTQSTDRKLLYCKQCGYTIFREEAPYRCPICQAKQEMFAEIIVTGEAKTREIWG